jgi:gamma-glutamylcyclotransferase (GGCT)/AIG2-like uncharacterized protein YtfP
MNETVWLFVYGSLLSGGRNRINVLKRIPYTFSGAKLYKHVEEDYPTIHLTGQENDLVQGELIEVESPVFDTLYELESDAHYECTAKIEEGESKLIHFFHKHLYIGKRLKNNYLYVGSSWVDYCNRND